MTVLDLQKKVAEALGVSHSEKAMAFDIFIAKICEILAEDLSLKIPQIGFFQLKKNKSDENEPDSIIFSPFSEDMVKDARNLYLLIDVPAHLRNQKEFDPTVFSIGVGAPLLPLSNESQTSSDLETSYAILRKSIEERVSEIISDSDQLPNFNMWDDYYESLSIEHQSEKGEEQNKLAELTSDLEFKDDLIAEDITNNLLDLELHDNITKFKNSAISEEDLPELSPSDLLEDYKPREKERLIEIIPQTNEIEVELRRRKKDTEIKINNIKNILNEEFSEEELMSHEGLEKSSEEDYETFIRKEKIKNEEVTYLGLKKREDEKIDWNWGDDLREEFGTDFVDKDKPKYDFLDEDEEEPEISIQKDIFKQTKPNATNLFETLEHSIKKELADSEKELQYIEYSGPPPKYEFIEDNLPAEDYRDQYSYNEPSRMTSEEEIYEQYRTNKKDKSFGKGFFIISFAFLIITVVIIYLKYPKKVENQTNANQTVVQPIDTQKIVSSLPAETQKTILNENNDDFPRVASLPIKDRNTTQGQNLVSQPISSKNRTTLNGLYRMLSTDTKIAKTIYFDGASYNVQTSSWRNKIKAEQEVKRLRDQGFDAFLVEVYLPQKGGTWYRARIGSFRSKEEAEQFLIKNNFEK